MPYGKGLVEAANWKPIRKLVAVFIGAGLMTGAQALGVDLGSNVVNDAATVLAGLALGYAVRDPRVVS